MSTFVYLVNTSGLPYQQNDTDLINEILTKLQHRGAKITSVTASIDVNHSSSSTKILYVIAYEAPGPISL